MWKIAVGFAVFAALALFILSKGGDIDMGGEKHGEPIYSEAPAAANPANLASPASPASSTASSAPVPGTSASPAPASAAQ